jgi:hypothetical protein
MSLYDKEKNATSDPAIAKDKKSKVKRSKSKPASCCIFEISK